MKPKSRSKNGVMSATRTLGMLSLVLITVGAVDSIRNLPSIALFGSPLIFFFLVAAVVFLLPSTLVAAELTSTWPEHGGVYLWVKQAFGSRLGFLAIWLQWVENLIWYPTILSFLASSIGYLISPTFANDKYFLISTIVASFWGTTLVNLFGVRSSALLSNICSVIGLLLPMILIIALGLDWALAGKPIQISLQSHNLLPNLRDPQMYIALTGIMMSYCGMEIATIHAGDVPDAAKHFPRALLIAATILFVTLVLGSLSIAAVIPGPKISLVSGIMQIFDAFFSAYHLHWLMPLVALMLVMGCIGGVNSWIMAPARGLFIAAREGHLPKHFRHQNQYGAPSIVLFYQALIVTLLVAVFLFMPSVSGSYWLLTVLASQLYMLMYLLMFAAAVYLRFKHPLKKRPFKIPGGKFGIFLVASMGAIAAILTFGIGFIPPNNIRVGSHLHFRMILVGSLLVVCLPVLFSSLWQKLLQRRLDAEIK